MMKFTAYSVSTIGTLSYIGTWIADSYENATQMIISETGLNIESLKIYGRI